ncbi:hypothetical protein ACF3NV_08530 [Moraxella atlantae]|uniref:hypothetical protein n=1 Tax=Faucicola atlantae TaxID=34059 RepID=UPI0037507AD4
MSKMNKLTLNNKSLKVAAALPALACAIILSACQSTQTAVPVIQRPNNLLETTGLGKTKVAAQTNALNYARQQCRRRTPIVLSDTYRYNGVLDENMGRVADQAIGVLGGMVGMKKTSIARDDDYEYTITFRCQ